MTGPAYVTILSWGTFGGGDAEVFMPSVPEPWDHGARLHRRDGADVALDAAAVKGAFVGLQWAKRMHGF